MNIAVSIVVPIYNVASFLERCVESLRNQTLDALEIILVDDESPDECPGMCDEYRKKDARIKVVHKKNEGLGFARNAGIEVAEGEYIAFIDSDDYVENDMFENLYQRAIKEDADAVISGGFIIERSDGGVYLNKERGQESIFNGNTNVLALEMMGALPDYPKDYVYEMSACKGIYKLELIKKEHIRFYSEREFISEDLIFHMDFFKCVKKVICVPECYYHYCENGASLTKSYRKDRFEKNVAFYKYVIGRLNEYIDNDGAFRYAQRMLLARARVCIMHIVAHYGLRMITKKEIMRICSTSELIEVLENYPVELLPGKQKVFAVNMKKQNWFFLYLLVKLNTIAKK